MIREFSAKPTTAYGRRIEELAKVDNVLSNVKYVSATPSGGGRSAKWCSWMQVSRAGRDTSQVHSHHDSLYHGEAKRLYLLQYVNNLLVCRK